MKKNQTEIKLPFESDAFKLAWDEWLQFRRERRLAGYVPTGLKKTFTALVNNASNNEQIAIKIIQQSIENNWQGLFSLKNNTNGTAINQNGITKPKSARDRQTEASREMLDELRTIHDFNEGRKRDI